jgi:hypothetical protein
MTVPKIRQRSQFTVSHCDFGKSVMVYPCGLMVVAQYDSGRLCAHARSLVPLVKTRDFGMTPERALS